MRRGIYRLQVLANICRLSVFFNPAMPLLDGQVVLFLFHGDAFAEDFCVLFACHYGDECNIQFSLREDRFPPFVNGLAGSEGNFVFEYLDYGDGKEQARVAEND